MNIYQSILAARSDMTNWVIHFTRADDSMTARARLAKILSEGLLRPGWSIRSGRPTIYGGRQAVCFTEQPLLSFTQYLSARPGNLISGYAVAVHKSDLYADGGRPVIYGLDTVQEVEAADSRYVSGQRTLSNFEPLEQYRFIVFNPNASPPKDWSHEREWRWPSGAREPGDPEPNEVGAFRLGGSGVASDDGYSEGRCHVIVEREADIRWLQQTASTWPIPAPTSWYKTRWHRRLKSGVGIVSLERVKRELAAGNADFGRLETWPATDPIPLVIASPSNQPTAGDLFR